MEARPMVAVVGDSLLTDSIEASLIAKSRMAVVRLLPSSDALEQQLPFVPDLIIVDLDTTPLGPILGCMRKLPGVPVLGLEADSDQVIALSSRRYTANTFDELSVAIRDIMEVSRTPCRPALVADRFRVPWLGSDATPWD